MKRVIAAVTVAVTLATAVPAAAAPPVAGRAMWLWTGAAPAQVVAWAVRQRVTTIFVSVDQKSDLGRLRDLKRRADAARIRLDALGGDPDWIADPAAALAWSRAVEATGLFAGRHVDAEPYLSARWDTDRAGTATGYLRLLDTLRRGGRTPLEVDVPFWYGEIAFEKGTSPTRCCAGSGPSRS
jgi:hypothetical protein